MDCDVCVEPYDLSGRRPKNLPCGHSTCATCIGRLKKQACPACRKEFNVNPEDLPDSYALMELIRGTPDNRLGRRSWCEECKAVASAACEENHLVMRMKAALRRQVKRLRELLPQVQEDLEDELLALQEDNGREQLVLESLQHLTGTTAPQGAYCDLNLRRDDGAPYRASWRVSPDQPGKELDSYDPLENRLVLMLVCLLAKKGTLQPAKACINELDLRTLSAAETGVDQEEKEAVLTQAGQLGVRRLVHLECSSDPDWSLQLLQRAAPLLEELDVGQAGREHLLALHSMPRLRRLNLSGHDNLSSLEEPAEGAEPAPELSPLPPHHRGLRWLQVWFGVPRSTTESMLRAHSGSLQELVMVVGTRSEEGHVWPEQCGDLHELLVQCGLQALQRLVLWRSGCVHSEEDCRLQLDAVQDALPNAKVLCSTCSDLPFENV